MRDLSELLRLIRYAQARMSVAYHQRDLERAREGLAKAYAAHDAALADLRANEYPPTQDPPQSLLRRKVKR